MNIQEFLKKMNLIQQHLLEYIDNENNHEIDHQNLSQFLHQNYENFDELEKILVLISKIANNHHRFSKFFANIEKILLIIKDDIIKYFPNEQIFKIFNENKKIILFFIKNDIIKPDKNFENIINDPKIIKYHYKEYLYPELKEISNKTQEYEGYDKDLHEEKRNVGENDFYICNLIRNDLIEDFISHVNQNNISLLSKIKPSIFETNPYLIDNQPSLIEYASFFGSIQIVKYLQLNKVRFEPSMWHFAVHSRNPELIHLLEENGIKPTNGNINNFIRESLKCHHNEIANYIIENYSNQNSKDENVFLPSIQYCNYFYFPDNLKNKYAFFDLCAYNYTLIVKELLLKDKSMNLNFKIISSLNFFIKFQ